MNINTLREFLYLSKTLNFTTTAKQCFITQSVLSKHITSLENELGVNLFIRNQQRVRLTDIGQTFSEDVEEILIQYDEAIDRIDRMKNSIKDVLKVGYLYGAASSFLGNVHSDFIMNHSDIELKLYMIEGTDLQKSLDENTVDVILTMVYDKVDPTWFTSYKIYDDYYGILIPKTHQLASRSELSISDLEGETLLIPNKVRFYAQWFHIQNALKTAAPDLDILDIVNDANDMVSPVVTTGNRISLVPSHLLRFLSLSQVRFIPLTDPYISFDVCAVWKKSKETATVTAFIDSLSRITESMNTDVLRNRIEPTNLAFH